MAGVVYHWQDPEPLARWTYMGVLASAVLTATTTFLALRFELNDPSLMSEDPARAMQLSSVTTLLSLLSLLCYIPGIMWLHRVSANAHAVEKNMKHAPAAAWLWFIVPFANLVMPFLVLKEIWRTTGDRSQGALTGFWAFSVLSNLFGFVAVAMVFANFGQAPPDWITYVTLGLSAPLYVFFAWMVASLTRAQKDSVRIADTFSSEDEDD